MEKTATRSFFTQSLKGGLVAFVLSTAFVLLLALVAKLFSMSADPLPAINQVLKAVAVVLGVGICVKDNNFLVKGLGASLCFCAMNLLLYVVLGGNVDFAQIGVDLAISAAVALLVSLLKSRKR